jgi:antibiotic biosynthesis monooxygenase (ABM) superfamily enzyme
MRANVYGRYDREVMVSKYSEQLARLYKAQVELYRLIIEDAETSKIETAVSRVATPSFELTEMPDIPETVKEWHERIMEKAFPGNALSGSPNSSACGSAPPTAGSSVPRWPVTLRGTACDRTVGATADWGPVTGVIRRWAKPGTESDVAEWATGITVAAERFPGNLSAALIREQGSRDFHLTWHFAIGQTLQRWLTSPERARRQGKVRNIAGARTAVQQRTGVEAWFCVPGHATQTIKPPPHWKQFLVSLVAVYPLVLLFQAVIAPQIKDWPLEAKSALLPLCVLTLLTYVVMPPVSRLLRGWLGSSSRARRRGRPAGSGSAPGRRRGMRRPAPQHLAASRGEIRTRVPGMSASGMR